MYTSFMYVKDTFLSRLHVVVVVKLKARKSVNIVENIFLVKRQNKGCK